MRGEFDTDADEARHIVSALVGAFPTDCRETALSLIGRTTGQSKWAVRALMYGRRKIVASNVMQALRRAYLDYLGRQIVKLEAQLRDAEMRSGTDDFHDLAAAAESVVSRLKAARERQR